MNIFCTNDDGYNCSGIQELSKSLRAEGHNVVVLSPDRDRSGASHSLGMVSSPIFIKQVSDYDWICSGTPADCVLVLVSGGVKFTPDAIASGINAGSNLGTDIVFSGTAGAARQGSLCGIPSIAFSLAGNGPFDFKPSALWAAANFEKLIKQLKAYPASLPTGVERNLRQWDIFFNINFPATSDFDNEAVLTFPARRRYFDKCRAEEADDGWKRLNFGSMKVETETSKGSDADALDNKRISLSAIKVQPAV
ncbi:MAG: 5'/3'-nucleotidase SurE [Termitinemataceae bacterium]|nr:MAG: 5'/3'-nucleotidase SurE [Termitinemataceae bacterium]